MHDRHGWQSEASSTRTMSEVAVCYYGGNLEEDKRATTNVQNGLVFFFLFSSTKGLNFQKVLGEKCE